MSCRLLSLTDYEKGYFELLSQLTIAPKVSFQKFSDTLQKIEKSTNTCIRVIEDHESQMIIGSGTVIIEQKFIRECRSVGHIEDVVVHKDYRKQGLGTILIQELIDLCQSFDCYKIILDCSPENFYFYKNCGLKKSDSQNMVLYF
jgi:glucosamine-phosphate N-acetyltransferase